MRDSTTRHGWYQRSRLTVALVAIMTLSGCAHTKNFSSVKTLQPTANTPPRALTIVLMPMDVELSVLTAGGLTEPNAAWTKTAETYLLQAFQQIEQTREKRILRHERPPPDDPATAKLNEIEHLHGAVGGAIMLHKLLVPLPSKKDKFDWSLGSEISVLREHAQADYALFVYIRDSYSSAGRVLAQLAAAALGVGISGGQQVGFASLVDLTSGNVVWFNFLTSMTGDLRDLAGAKSTLDNLLAGIPQ
jgi:hypothetical protein